MFQFKFEQYSEPAKSDMTHLHSDFLTVHRASGCIPQSCVIFTHRRAFISETRVWVIITSFGRLSFRGIVGQLLGSIGGYNAARAATLFCLVVHEITHPSRCTVEKERFVGLLVPSTFDCLRNRKLLLLAR